MKKKFLDLGTQPITNAFLTKDDFDNEFTYNLSIGINEDTKLVSLIDFVEPEMMFNETYAHRASMSKTMRDSFKKVAESLKEEFKPKKVLEIGSNDGVFLRNFDVDEIVAIEPCENLAVLTNDMGYKTYDTFWDSDAARNVKEMHGDMDVIYSANTICHIENLDEVFKATEMALSKDGVFVFEDPSLYSVLNNTSYDQFYDEHVHLFSVLSLSTILSPHGLEIFKVDNLTTHGGSNRIYVKKVGNNSIRVHESVKENLDKELVYGMDDYNTYEEFANRVRKSKEDLIRIFSNIKHNGRKIISYGATYKSATVFNYCQIGTDLIDYITDTTPNKQGKYSPGMHIPIISPEEGFNDTVDYAFLGAWNFAKEIMANESKSDFIKYGGKFITHVPEVRILKN